MVQIVIVEDSEKDREHLLSCLNAFRQTHMEDIQITSFSDGFTFLEQYDPNWDILLLDIELPQMNGIELARRVRERDQNIVLIFTTNMAQYAINGYEVGALDYLLKPLQPFLFSAKLEKAMQRATQKDKRFLAIDTPSGVYKVSIQSIRYIESDKHYLNIYTSDGLYRTRETLPELEERLQSDFFSRCHASYLVNLRYAMRVGQAEVVLENGIKLPISRTYKKPFLDAFATFLGGM